MTESDDRVIGFIGLGLMGKPMARNSHKAANQAVAGLSIGAVVQVLLQ